MAIKIPLITEFDGGGIKKAVEQFKQLEGAGKKAQFALKKAAVPAAAALAGLGGILVSAAKGAEDARRANQKLANVLDSMGFKEATDRTIEYAESLEKTLAVDADVIKATQTKLATFGNLAKSVDQAGGAFDRATLAALDLASAGFGSAEGNAVALGKALENPIKGITALAKSGVTFTEQEKEKIKALTESGNLLEAQNIVLAAIEKQVGGTTEASASSFEKMKFAFAGVADTIGEMVLPILDQLAPLLAGISTWAQENPTLMKVAIIAIGGLATAIVGLNVAMKAWTVVTTAATVAQKAFNLAMSANPILLATAAIVAIGAAIVVAYKKFEPFKEVVDKIGKALKAAFTGTVDAIKTAVNAYMGIYKGLFNAIAKAWNSTVGKLSFKIPSWVPGIGGKGFEVPKIPELASGGIVMSPTLALIGEAGPEAVVPLDRMGSMSTNVVINVNGGDPNAVVDALRRYYRSNGPIPVRTYA